MKYTIIIEPTAQDDLKNIYNYIKNNDFEQRAKNFLLELKQQIKSLEFMPNRCRNSHYSKEKNTKDLIYKGYIIVYTILDSTVHILAVFRQKN